MNKVTILMVFCFFVSTLLQAQRNEDITPQVRWVYIDSSTNYPEDSSCSVSSECATNTICLGLELTPSYSGNMQSYTSTWLGTCPSPVFLNQQSCVMTSAQTNNFFDLCEGENSIYLLASGQSGDFPVTADSSYIVHTICFEWEPGIQFTLQKEQTNADYTWSPNGIGAEEFQHIDQTLSRDEFCPECRVPAFAGGINRPTNVGITTLERGNEEVWVIAGNNGFLKLESRTKGFVPTRLSTAERNQLEAVEGMLIFNTTTDCLEYYDGTAWLCSTQCY
ncbi:MAG: hypothetical protein Q4F57_05930 [Weeksellaceae bacterium]|nr:hypothetical protein [Weeksellaceae bacterium]